MRTSEFDCRWTHSGLCSIINCSEWTVNPRSCTRGNDERGVERNIWSTETSSQWSTEILSRHRTMYQARDSGSIILSEASRHRNPTPVCALVMLCVHNITTASVRTRVKMTLRYA